MAKRVQVDFHGNAQPFINAANKVQHKMKEIVGLGEFLKGGLVTALGGGTIAAIAEHMGTFAKNIQDASKRLGISVGQVIELKKAAHQAGVEFESWYLVKRKTESFLQDVVNGKNGSFAARLGITSDNARSMRWTDALAKALEANASRADLAKLVGPRAVDWVQGSRKEIIEYLKSNKKDINAEAVDTMARFKLELEFLIEEIEIGLLPALSRLVEWIEKHVTKGLDTAEAKRNAIRAGAAASGVTIDRNAQMGIFPSKESFLVSNLGSAFGMGTKSKAQADKFLKEAGFTPEGIAVFWKTMAQENQKVEDKEKNREASRQRRIKELENGPRVEDRVPTQASLSKEFATNQFLKIGGLMGIDVTYRLERLGYEQLAVQREIRDILAGRNESAPELDSEPINLGAAL